MGEISKLPGPDTLLDDKLMREIKEGILKGLNLKEIANLRGIAEQTLYSWSRDNYLNLADKIENWKRDRKLLLAERNIEEFLEMPHNTTDKMKVKADISKFVAETLGKDTYSKRGEITGKNGEAIQHTVDILTSYEGKTGKYHAKVPTSNNGRISRGLKGNTEGTQKSLD